MKTIRLIPVSGSIVMPVLEQKSIVRQVIGCLNNGQNDHLHSLLYQLERVENNSVADELIEIFSNLNYDRIMVGYRNLKSVVLKILANSQIDDIKRKKITIKAFRYLNRRIVNTSSFRCSFVYFFKHQYFQDRYFKSTGKDEERDKQKEKESRLRGVEKSIMQELLIDFLEESKGTKTEINYFSFFDFMKETKRNLLSKN